ncbi:hypothetical protein CcaCcLH18_12794 [Colletotrichum camelliae]|nr:hypothetical protein CcaCcLH18_12794 [Colletotrichum camelliae]
MPGYNQPTESSSRKGVERPLPPARPQPESPLGRVHAIESSVCSDIGPSLTIKQRPETQQQAIHPARAGPEHPTYPTAKVTTGDSLLERTLGRSVHHDRIDSMPSAISSSNAKNFSSKNLSSMTGHANIKDPHRPMDAVSAGVEGVKQPKTSMFETPGHSAEPAKEAFAPGMITIRPESAAVNDDDDQFPLATRSISRRRGREATPVLGPSVAHTCFCLAVILYPASDDAGS